MKKHVELLEQLRACKEAKEWVESCGRKSAETMWSECQRGDWMLWLLCRLNVDRKRLVLAACECADLSLKFVPKNESRPATAIETARKWCRGEATIDDVRRAAAAAYTAAAYTAAAYAAYAAYDAAAYTAYDAAAQERSAILSKCADITRQYFPTISEHLPK